MGFINKLLSKCPGGPASTAKTMLRSYNLFRCANPDMPETDIYRDLLRTRYAVFRKMTHIQIENAAILAESIGDLISIVIFHDTPMSFSRDMIGYTLEELDRFYMQHAPEERSSLERSFSVIRAWCS